MIANPVQVAFEQWVDAPAELLEYYVKPFIERYFVTIKRNNGYNPADWRISHYYMYGTQKHAYFIDLYDTFLEPNIVNITVDEWDRMSDRLAFANSILPDAPFDAPKSRRFRIEHEVRYTRLINIHTCEVNFIIYGDDALELQFAREHKTTIPMGRAYGDVYARTSDPWIRVHEYGTDEYEYTAVFPLCGI